MKFSHIVINSNKWYSAVSDYSLQLAFNLNKSASESKETVIYLAHEKSPNLKKAQLKNIKTGILPLLPSGIVGFFRSWVRMTSLLSKQPQLGVVWVFEGREHTLCALHKFVRRALWKHRTLVRVRGQAAEVKQNFLNRWLYESGTNKVVFAANIVKARTPFVLSDSKARVQHYACDFSEMTTTRESMGSKTFSFLPEVPNIDFSFPTFLVVGRYDPVKAHALLLEAFSQADFSVAVEILPVVQLIFIGESQNTKAQGLFEVARDLFPESTVNQSANRYFVQSLSQKKRIFVFDERIENVSDFMKNASFGVIPSLDSEVICRVAVEFLQSSTPLLVSDAGALAEIVDDTCGRVFRAGDVRALKNSLEWGFEAWAADNTLSRLRAGAKTHGDIYKLVSFDDMVEWVTL